MLICVQGVRWAAHSVVFSHCSQLRGSLRRKAAVPTPADSSRRLGAFWAHQRSLWVEWPNVSALAHHQVHVEMIWIGILILQANSSQRALLRKVIWELAFGSEGPVFMPVTRGHCTGSREHCPSHPAADPRFTLQSEPSCSQGVAGTHSSEPGCFFWLWLSYQLHDTEPASYTPRLTPAPPPPPSLTFLSWKQGSHLLGDLLWRLRETAF